MISNAKALNHLLPDAEYEKYIAKWKNKKESWFWKTVAFTRKAIQKLTEKQTRE